jgi:predicted hotdog family 3-hydroxylacyl-ACP dehydratase
MAENLSLPLDRAWIAARIPHAGAMCLLDKVVAFTDEHILCSAISHRDAQNPLRSNGRLAAVCGIEYAAQAMAVHGFLLNAAKQGPRVGFLASLRNVDVRTDRLDTLDETLMVEAVRFSGDDNNVLYDFTLRYAERTLLHGRAAVVLDAGDLGLPDDRMTTKVDR